MLKKSVQFQALALGTMSMLTMIVLTAANAQEAVQSTALAAKGGANGAGNGGGTLAVFSAMPGPSGASALEKLAAAYEEGSDFDPDKAAGRWVGLFTYHRDRPDNEEAGDSLMQVILQVSPIDLGVLGKKLSLMEMNNRFSTIVSSNDLYQIDGSYNSYGGAAWAESLTYSINQTLVASLSKSKLVDGVALQDIPAEVTGKRDGTAYREHAHWVLHFKTYRDSLIGLISPDGSGNCGESTTIETAPFGGYEIGSLYQPVPINGYCAGFVFYKQVEVSHPAGAP